MTTPLSLLNLAMKNKRLWVLFAVFGFALVGVGIVHLIKDSMARYLTQGEVRHAKIGFVLEGQWPSSYRTDFATQLLKNRIIDTLLISGSKCAFAPYSTAKLYSSKMITEGIEPQRLYEFTHVARSTWQEAQAVIPWLRSMKADTVALISSSYHLKRTAWIFNHIAQGHPYFFAITRPNDPDFDPDLWWKDREQIVFFVTEWTKMLKTFQEIYLGANDRSLTDTSLSQMVHLNPGSYRQN